MTHTPGPWTIRRTGAAQVALAIAANGHDTVAAFPRGTDKDYEADARLIAAAPDLLEALKWCADAMGSGPCRDAADAAIAKAEGSK
jgi:hypothetical protein